MFTQRFVKSEEELPNLECIPIFLSLINLCATGINLNLLNDHQSCSLLFTHHAFFLMFNKVRFFKHLWLFPFFNSLNLIFSSVVFVQSFLDLGCYLHLPSFPNPTATTFASFPCVLLHEFHLFIFCLCASPSWILLPEKFY